MWGEPLPAPVLPRLATVVAATERTWPSVPTPATPSSCTPPSAPAAASSTCTAACSASTPRPSPPPTTRAPPRIPTSATPASRTSSSSPPTSCSTRGTANACAPWPSARSTYRRENYTHELWLVEGLTSYYDRLIVLRSGEMPIPQLLKRTAADLARLATVPGRLVHSLEASSFDAWIKLYRPQDDSPNSSVSYYLKGSLVGLVLDLWLRGERPDGDGLDAVIADLWADQRSPNIPKNCTQSQDLRPKISSTV